MCYLAPCAAAVGQLVEEPCVSVCTTLGRGALDGRVSPGSASFAWPSECQLLMTPAQKETTHQVEHMLHMFTPFLYLISDNQ